MKKTNLFFLIMLLACAGHAQQAAFSILGNEQRCRDSVYRFQNQSTGATSYSWDFGDGSPASNAVNPTHTYSWTGNFVVTLQAFSGGNVSVVRKAIYVKNQPYASFYLNTYGIILPGTALRFENNSNTAEAQQWSFGDGQSSRALHPVHTYTKTGKYDVRLVVYNGCGDSSEYTQMVEITDSAGMQPKASFYTNGKLYCPDTRVGFTQYAENYTRLVWDFGDGSRITTEDQQVYHSYTDTGVYTVTLYAYNGSKVDSSSAVVEISKDKLELPYTNASPIRKMGTSFVLGNCVNLPIRLQVFNSQQKGSKAYWRISDGRVLNSTDTSVSFAATGNYGAWFVMENACGAKDSLNLSIFIRSSDAFISDPPDIRTTPNSAICPGGVVRFNAPYEYGNNVTWNWEINGQKFNDTSEVIFTAPSKDTGFMVTLYRVPDCGAVVSTSMMVYATPFARPSADFMVESGLPWSGPGCYRDTLKLNGNTGANAGNAVTHFWDFGDGSTSTAERPSHVFSKPGWYSIMHATTNSCGTTETQVLSIHTRENVAPLPRFYAMPFTVCFGDSVMFDNFTMGADSTIIDYGDGERLVYTGFGLPHIFHAYQKPGQYKVRLYVFNNCSGDSAQITVTVRKPIGAAILMRDTLVQPGSTLELRFSAGSATSHLWYRSAMAGDTTSARSFTRRYDQEGNYKVYLHTRGAYGCAEWDSVGIRVAMQSRVALPDNGAFRAVVYPNPTAGASQMKLQLLQAAAVEITLRDINGRLLGTLARGQMAKGPHHFEIPTSGLSPGVYILHIQAGTEEESIRLLKQQ